MIRHHGKDAGAVLGKAMAGTACAWQRSLPNCHAVACMAVCAAPVTSDDVFLNQVWQALLDDEACAVCQAAGCVDVAHEHDGGALLQLQVVSWHAGGPQLVKDL